MWPPGSLKTGSPARPLLVECERGTQKRIWVRRWGLPSQSLQLRQGGLAKPWLDCRTVASFQAEGPGGQICVLVLWRRPFLETLALVWLDRRHPDTMGSFCQPADPQALPCSFSVLLLPRIINQSKQWETTTSIQGCNPSKVFRLDIGF